MTATGTGSVVGKVFMEETPARQLSGCKESLIEPCICPSKEICAYRTDICASNAVKKACAIFKIAAVVGVEDIGAIFSVGLRRKREKREREYLNL